MVCPSSQRRDKDLHVSSEAQNKMQRAFLLVVVIRQCSCILNLLARQLTECRRNGYFKNRCNHAHKCGFTDASASSTSMVKLLAEQVS